MPVFTTSQRCADALHVLPVSGATLILQFGGILTGYLSLPDDFIYRAPREHLTTQVCIKRSPFYANLQRCGVSQALHTGSTRHSMRRFRELGKSWRGRILCREIM